jgi:N6-L-threonylcarbamoyladenine synthase
MPCILAIESSCDDTSAAVIKNGIMLSNTVSGQEIHTKFGGVVPELASRAHQKHILPVVDTALKAAKINLNQLDAIAFTQGPGLLGSLMVGISFAKGLALSLNKPLIGVNHMQAHILAHFIKETGEEQIPQFPFICLTVSGGHTQLVLVKSPLEMEILGQTIDDAAGEAFDKAAKILGLPYPGGPLIDKLANQGEPKYDFTIPNIPGLNFSFSGLKTQFLYFIQNQQQKDPNFLTTEKENCAASIQQIIVKILLSKLRKAVRETGVKTVALAGGVSANSRLRNELKKLAEKENYQYFIPEFQFCTDNAGMIAMAAHFMYQEQKFAALNTVPNPRLKF